MTHWHIKVVGVDGIDNTVSITVLNRNQRFMIHICKTLKDKVTSKLETHNFKIMYFGEFNCLDSGFVYTAL